MKKKRGHENCKCEWCCETVDLLAAVVDEEVEQ